MNKKLSVADAKKHLSEIMSRVAYNNERFLIERRGKPMAALVSAEDLARLERESNKPKGLMAAVGAWSEFDEIDEMVQHIYKKREEAWDREVNLDE
ncbi:MAG: hypothetical protein BZY81_04080 [SAR202 cluster bacterium Io17-Chloro-G4]|nr:MAG: hypothetical protein BZY81_04080 [SAR202 cluster bacterium Io17-Chloro-G4]